MIRKAPTANFISTWLDGPINDSTQTITLHSTANLQAPGAIVVDRVDANGVSLPNSREVIEYLVINGNDLEQCIRGADQSTARSHSDGALVETNVTVGTFNSLISAILTVADANGYLAPLASPASLAILQSTTFLNTSIASIAQLMIKTRLDLSGAGLSGVDGWIQSNDTWTYASASTFTIAGVDRTSVYTKGTRLKFTQTGTKYAVVLSSSFSTDTTVTILVNTDYTIANAAITVPYYSYAANPQGYPGFFTDTPGVVGFASFNNQKAIYQVLGNWIRIWYSIDGTSNSTAFTITLPVAPILTEIDAYFGGGIRARDNGNIVGSNGAGAVWDAESSTTLQLYKDYSSTVWTASNTKSARFGMDYKF